MNNKVYKSISEVSNILKINKHVIRYWEREFKQIKPTIINRRRYYSFKDIKTIQNIKFYLKPLCSLLGGCLARD